MKGLALPVAWVSLGGLLVVAAAIVPMFVVQLHIGGYINKDTDLLAVSWGRLSPIMAGVGIAALYALLRPPEGLPRKLGWAHLGAWGLGCLLIYGPGWVLPFTAAPRRYEDFLALFRWLNWMSSAGYALVFTGFLLFLAVLVDAGARALRSARSSPSR